MGVEPETDVTLGPFRFRGGDGTLWHTDGSSVPLRRQSAAVLGVLARHNGQLVPKDVLVREVWGGLAVTDDSLIQCIRDIRRALRDNDRTILETEVGRGYRLNGSRPEERGPGDRPLVCLVPIDGIDGSGEALREALAEVLATRAGLRLTLDAARAPEARFVISGRVSTEGRAFIRITDRQEDREIFARTLVSDGREPSEWVVLIAARVDSFLRMHSIIRGGRAVRDLVDAELDQQALLAKAAAWMTVFTVEHWTRARATLEHAVARDDTDPMALAMRASMATHMAPLVPFASVPDRASDMLALADRAVRFGPRVDFVLRTRGNLRLWLNGDHDGAARDCARALDVSPEFHLIHLTLGTSDILNGRPGEGVARLERSMEIEVDQPQYALFRSLIALGLILDGQSARAVEAARDAVEHGTHGSWAALVFAMAVGDASEPGTEAGFRELVSGISLPPHHLRDMPFSSETDVSRLEALWARAASV